MLAVIQLLHLQVGDDNLKPLLLSGGAIGADTEWSNCAQQTEHDVCHFSFAGHNSKCCPSTVVILSDYELKIADSYLKFANKIIKRKFPCSSEYTNNLLRRNYYQIKDANMLYAVTSFNNDMVPEGGTSWAIIMSIIKPDISRYIFDQLSNQWFLYNSTVNYFPISKPPLPYGVWASIGTRKLNYCGLNAINSIFQITNT